MCVSVQIYRMWVCGYFRKLLFMDFFTKME